jgi:hypothetical protein
MTGEADVSEEGQVFNGKTAASSNFNNVLRASQLICP